MNKNIFPVLVGGIGEINFGKQYRQGNRVYSADTIAMALTANPVGNAGGYSYLYAVREGDGVIIGAENAEIRPKDRDYNKKGLPRNPQLEIFGDGISYALRTGQQVKAVEIHEMENLRIRKLTPKECFRLMGFDDADCDVLSNNGISNTQIYKMAGNSIVVDVLEAIFDNLKEQYDL